MRICMSHYELICRFFLENGRLFLVNTIYQQPIKLLQMENIINEILILLGIIEDEGGF